METLISFCAYLFAPLLLLLSSTLNRKGRFLQGAIAITALFWASSFAAARFEVGEDWDGYEQYYEAIDTGFGMIAGYIENPSMWRFEPGYYLVCYVTKLIGAPYTLVNSISVVTLVIAIILFIRRLSVPPQIIVLVFIGLPFVILFYNQVRQCFAIAFLLFSIQVKSHRLSLLFGFLAPLFQASTVVFAGIALVTRFRAGSIIMVFRVGLILVMFFGLIVVAGLINPYDLLRFIMPETLSFKIDLYEGDEISVGFLRYCTVGYLLYLAGVLFRKAKRLVVLTTFELDVMGNASFSSLLVLCTLLVFPNAYSFYGRASVYALIMLSMSGAILHKIKLKKTGVIIDILPFYGLGILSIAYYLFFMLSYGDVYFPYRSVLSR